MAEIILGSKRPSRTKKLVRLAAIASVLMTTALMVGWFVFRRATTYPVPRGTVPSDPLIAESIRLRLGASSLERVGSLWVTRLSGGRYELGAARARLLGSMADQEGALDVALVGEQIPSGFLSHARYEARLAWRHRLLAHGIPEVHRQEIAGQAAGMRMAGLVRPPSYQRLIWRQAAFDIGAPPGTRIPIGGLASGMAFVVGGGVEEGGRAIIGRSFSLPGVSDSCDVLVSFIAPADAIAFASVGCPGAIGVMTGINAEGIAIVVNPAVAERISRSAAAEPIALLARDVLEGAKTLEEAVSLLTAHMPLGAASFLVVDGNARTYAIVERSPAKTSVIKGKKGGLSVGDFLVGPEFEKDAENDRARRLRENAGRSARLRLLLAKGVAPEPELVLAVLRDRLAVDGRELALGNGNAIDDLSQAHVAIIDASSMLLWVGEGPGAAGQFRTFDLRAELRGETPRITSTLDLPADSTVDASAAARLAEARRHLRIAHGFKRQGRRKLARDAVARTMALAPDLAEPHKLAADLARADKDDDLAARHYRRYLELDPADRGAIEDARSALGSP